jgi:hypothetical protein
MVTVALIEYEDASPEVRQVYDHIMAARKVDGVNNFWKTQAVDPDLLNRRGRGSKRSWPRGH